MEVLLILAILGVALLLFAVYRASKHGGYQSIDEGIHEGFRKGNRGQGTASTRKDWTP
jgi:hypothetical protein